MNIIKTYQGLESKHQKVYDKVNKQFNIVSIIRLIIVLAFLGFIYFFFKTDDTNFLWAMLIAFISFVFVMKWHDKIAFQRLFSKTLIQINKDEIKYLKQEEIPFDNGIEFQTTKHDYSFDLDFFGNNSLYQHFNRTATYIGKTTLANNLLVLKKKENILLTQDAIKELAKKNDFRQEILALAKLTKDSKSIYLSLMEWSAEKNSISKILHFFSYLFPAIFLSCFIMSFLSANPIFSKLSYVFFIVNMAVLSSQFKKINKEISNFTKINQTMRNYGLIIEKIENEQFENNLLVKLQKKLVFKDIAASKQINNLSSLFKQIESILNPFAVLISNGFFLYHIHSYHALVKWKNQFASQIPLWLETIGNFEYLNSLANLSYNNPKFCFPEINEEYKISFEELGHPIINESERVNNNIDFNQKPFIILTGSNMSGKSTFLRSLGVNMVLAGIGAPICAKNANVHPLNVLVSMRLSDSLGDNESYFFAEVKRLKEIINKLDKKVSFVLLDEILRGTNSDDKRHGTIEVIKKIIAKKAIGSIATHDLEVCNTTNEFPEILCNKNFEVEIINNELVFDYKLREGICKNKSATFLMKKMEVI